MSTAQDFVRYSAKLRDIMGPHIVSLLQSGVSVVLDFHGNTVESRRWMRDILERSGADHQFHILSPPDEICLARLRARNASGDHPFSVTEEVFHRITRHFEPPSPDEGFDLIFHEAEP